MPVLAAVREGKTGRIGKTAGSAVDYFGDQSEGLESARAETFDQKQRGEIAEFLFVGHSKNRAETF